MNLDTFIEQRRPGWQHLEALVTRADRQVRTLSAQELRELGQYYRSATSDLALAQRDFPTQKVTQYLNQLVGRAHAVIYRSAPLRWQWVRQFYGETFPQLYRVLLPYTITAFAIFVICALAAFFTVVNSPDAIYVIAGPEIAPLVHKVEQGEMWTEIEPALRSAAAGVILTNNIQVMFLTFAGGITGGLLSLWVLLSNGLNIGAVFGLLQVHGMAGALAEFVVAHGFIELSVIFLAGGCGLYLGDGLVRPGLHARREVLVQRGQLGVRIILACAPLLVVAGLIEGFVSPSGLHWLVKGVVGLTTGCALHWYWLAVGR